MKIIRLSWLRGFFLILLLSLISYGVRAEYYIVTTPCCVVEPAFKYHPVKHKKHHYTKAKHHKYKYRHVHTTSCGHVNYSFSGSGAYGSYNVTVYEFYQVQAPQCGYCGVNCYVPCTNVRSFETRYGQPYATRVERYHHEGCYDPDLSTGDDNACTNPDMQIN